MRRALRHQITWLFPRPSHPCSGRATRPPPNSSFEIAGLVDRSQRRIVVAQKFRIEWRRFTTAHEIGHWVLHPGLIHHRDRPLEGGERANRSRPRQEQEADLFAAELLMPSKMVQAA